MSNIYSTTITRDEAIEIYKNLESIKDKVMRLDVQVVDNNKDHWYPYTTINMIETRPNASRGMAGEYTGDIHKDVLLRGVSPICIDHISVHFLDDRDSILAHVKGTNEAWPEDKHLTELLK